MKAFFVKLKTKLVASKALCVALSLFLIATAGLFVSSCGKKECKHNYEVVIVVAPTCTDQGYTTYRCSKCKETKNDDYVPANGHTYRNGECVYCHEKEPSDGQITEQEFYANMILSAAETDGLVFEFSELNVKIYITSNVFDDKGDISVTYEKIDDDLEINVKKAAFSFDAHGQLFGVLSGTASRTAGNEQFLSEYSGEFTAVLKDGMLYSSLVSEDHYADEESEPVTKNWDRIPLENVLVSAETNAMSSLASVYQAINAIGANIDEIRREISGLAGSAYELQKFVVENLFTKKEVDGGYEFRFDPSIFKKVVNYLFDNTVNDVINDIFGEKTSEKLSAFVLSSMNKTLDVVLTDLNTFGINYEDILQGLDSIYLKLTGVEKYFTTAVQQLLEQFDGIKLKTIIADATEMSESDIMGIVSEILEMFKTKNIIEVYATLFFNPPEGEKIDSLLANIRKTIEATADQMAEALGTDAFGFNTDMDGRIISYPVHLVDLLLVGNASGDENYREEHETKLTVKADIKSGKIDDIAEFNKLIAEIEGYTLVKPNTTIQGKFGQITLEFVSDENGRIYGLNVPEIPDDVEIEEFSLIDGYYTFEDYGYCNNWLRYTLYFRVSYTDGYSEIRSNDFYYNTVTKEVTATPPQAHDYEVVEDKTEYVCGGKITKKCTVCGYQVTTPIAHVGNMEQTYELAKEGGACIDGVIVTTTCSECEKVVDKSFVYSSLHFYLESDVEELTIPDQDENCNFKVYVSKCICGKQIGVDTVGHQSIGMIPCESGITDAQKQIDGYFEPGTYGSRYETLNSTFRYTCYDCDFVLYYDVLWLKAEDCTAELTAVIRYEKGTESGIIKKYVYETHTYHDYVDSVTENEETGLISYKHVCSVCGSSYEYTTMEYTDKDGAAHLEEIDVVINNLNDGNAKRVEEKYIRISGEEYYKEEYTTLTITADGKETVSSEKEEMTLYNGTIPKELEFAAKIVHEKDGIRSEQVIAGNQNSEKYYILSEYTENEDGTWVRKEYTYDFAAGCKYTVKITYSNGKTAEETGEDHNLVSRIIKGASCASDGIRVSVCLMCEQVVGKEQVIYAEGHEFVQRDEYGNLICHKCGALEDVEYEAILKMYGFETEDKTDYENGENYVVAYNGLQRDSFTLSLVLREKYGKSAERKEFGLALGEEDFIVDVKNRTISFDKAEADALKEAKIKELGADADDYYLTLSFTVVIGEKTVKLYREFKLPPLTEGVVSGECYYVVTAGNGEYAEITLTFTENVTLEMTSVVREDTKAWLYDENGEELVWDDDGGYDWNNFSITYSFEAGKTYKLKAGFYSDGTPEGPILILFTEKNVTVIL